MPIITFTSLGVGDEGWFGNDWWWSRKERTGPQEGALWGLKWWWDLELFSVNNGIFGDRRKWIRFGGGIHANGYQISIRNLFYGIPILLSIPMGHHITESRHMKHA